MPLELGREGSGSADAADADRFEQLEAVAGALRAAASRGPVVVVLDDLQWAGAASDMVGDAEALSLYD